ncbi:quinol:cytochrome C oxidoreductase [Paraflavitalea sp. CAU 1676]|uniref:quinol:cytochrome C oxidoreductase n=1 Tax=Paraflavitalea sp. CAU 1676 TaxID=3032598 RepID=UPI0023DCDD5E|nr:quinol:cytochrome C oxidoreductase [Paraflavitalea sp. CAU 1676]MDF2190906.1 quinol:cytochrome C oxidoreductase [Paraflavitalea sp. CAU 1676]
MASREFFEIPKRYKTWSAGLIGVGALSVIIAYIAYGRGEHPQLFWGALLQNSAFFLLVVNASMFFICATTLAMGGWQMSFRRVPEAISTAVVPIGIITAVVCLLIVLLPTHFYHWQHPDGDKILEFKKGFLNTPFYITFTLLTIVLWIVLGRKMRALSQELDNNPLPNAEAGRKYIFKNTVWASVFIAWFGLTTMSTLPWFWLMSIDAHWYSTMYSWYTFASTFVSGMALIALFVIYMKNKGYLEYTNNEHLHDIGKFMFAFSIFWTYLWFSQYMLIWYANIPEETVYFKSRISAQGHDSGPYSGIFWLSFVINFLAPLLLLMRRGAKRNYASMVFMAVVIIFGHWLDFYQMIFASIDPTHVNKGMFVLSLGIAAGFIGIIMNSVGNAMSKTPLVAKNHPFTKESIIHHT